MAALLAILTATSLALALDAPTTPPSNQTGRLPALGWNSWNAYHCDIDEAKVLAAANSFIDLGLKDAGYQYVNIDDCWSVKTGRDSSGKIVPEPTRFPNGIVGVANQVHDLGLKMGIYSDAGTNTCAGYPASLGNELIDVQTFASWGIDYLKYDNCNVPSNWTDAASPPGGDWYNSNSGIRYRQMTDALSKVSHPIQLDICIWGQANVWTWGPRAGHSWRMSGDASPTWSYIIDIIKINVQHLDTIDFFGHNDMDMMEIGNGNLTIQEQRTHFATWSFFKSPILLGTDLSKLNSEQVAIITNKELLAFGQDANIGTPAKPFTPTSGATTTSPPEFYAGPSSKGVHVFIMNIGSSTTAKSFKLSDVPGLSGSGRFTIHDMWTGTDVKGSFTAGSKFTVNLASHDTAAYLITPA